MAGCSCSKVDVFTPTSPSEQCRDVADERDLEAMARQDAINHDAFMVEVHWLDLVTMPFMVFKFNMWRPTFSSIK